ncbi:MAG: hypothetical protein K1X83_01110 [Oligoflexia bacterium]|nr:hypothetical protein [Oligoflexia bacterium]
MLSQSNKFSWIKPAGLNDFLVLLAFISLVALSSPEFALDPGVGWHLKTGQWILENNTIPYSDPFLAGNVARPWVSDQWLSDVVLYAVYSLQGWPFLYGFLLSVIAFNYLFIVRRGVLKATAAPLATCFAVLYAFKLGQIHFILRPVVFSYLMFSLVYFRVYKLYAVLKEERVPAFDWVLVLCFLVWANLHPGFASGLLLLGLLPVSILVDHFVLGTVNELPKKSLIQLSVLVFVCLLATLVNPYGYELHRSIIELGRSSYFMDLHNEWKSPSFKEAAGLYFLGGLLTLTIPGLLFGYRTVGWRAFELLMLSCFAIMSFRAIRVFPIFGIVCTLPLVQALHAFKDLALLQRTAGFSKLTFYLERLSQRERRSMMGTPVFCALVAIALAGSLWQGRLPYYPGPFGPPASHYPYGALSYLAGLRRPVVVACNPNWGGFFTLMGGGNIRPLLDDRNTLVGEEFHRRFMEKLSAKPGWEEYFKGLGATHLLVEKSTALATLLKQKGARPLLYEDNLAIVYGYDDE